MSVNERNAQSLNAAIETERRRIDDLTMKLNGANAAIATLRGEVETLRKLVLVQRTGTGPSVREDT